MSEIMDLITLTKDICHEKLCAMFHPDAKRQEMSTRTQTVHLVEVIKV